MWVNQRIKVPVEFRKFLSQPLEDSQLLKDNQDDSSDEKSNRNSDNKFEEEDTED